MTTYEATLKGREEIAEGTMAFHFEKPTGFSFKPRQAIDVILIDPPTTDAQSARHTFSIVSAPFQDELVVATRMRRGTSCRNAFYCSIPTSGQRTPHFWPSYNSSSSRTKSPAWSRR